MTEAESPGAHVARENARAPLGPERLTQRGCSGPLGCGAHANQEALAPKQEGHRLPVRHSPKFPFSCPARLLELRNPFARQDQHAIFIPLGLPSGATPPMPMPSSPGKRRALCAGSGFWWLLESSALQRLLGAAGSGLLRLFSKG